MARLPDRVRIGVVGLGWVGQEVARAAIEDPRVRLVGVADVDSAKAGRDLGEILGEGRLGLPIDSDLQALLSRARPEVAVITTSSDLEGLRVPLEQCLEHGAHVVTTCENLAAPELLDGDLVRSLEDRSRQAGLVILATGVNPGFAMDRLPVMLSQATRNIRRVRVLRVVDAASRRAQLQAKAGVGMDPKLFVEAMNTGKVGHAGLSASLRLVAKGLGVSLDRVTETLRPLLAETRTSSSVLGVVEPGKVRGIYQVARGYRADSELITLELIIALDEPNARDAIDIIGEPPLHFSGELPGDMCTVATVLSAIPLVVTMQPGLRTVLDVPLEQPEEPGGASADLISSRPASTAMTLRPDVRLGEGGGETERPVAHARAPGSGPASAATLRKNGARGIARPSPLPKDDPPALVSGKAVSGKAVSGKAVSAKKGRKAAAPAERPKAAAGAKAEKPAAKARGRKAAGAEAGASDKRSGRGRKAAGEPGGGKKGGGDRLLRAAKATGGGEPERTPKSERKPAKRGKRGRKGS